MYFISFNLLAISKASQLVLEKSNSRTVNIYNNKTEKVNKKMFIYCNIASNYYL